VEYRRLGTSDLSVSAVGLGGNNFGGRADAETSIKVINHALDLGVNFIDTSPAYADGRSEQLIGQAVGNRRRAVIIATKFGASSQITPGTSPGSSSYVSHSIEGSLRRLATDYVDILFVHNPDEATPIAETLGVLNELVEAGKVRHLGCSNFSGAHLEAAIEASRSANLSSFIASGAAYNMLDRRIERDLAPACRRLGVSVIPTLPLASGLLTGKYDPRQPPPGRSPTKAERRGRSELAPSMQPRDVHRFWSDSNFQKIEVLRGFAGGRGHRIGELAIAWLLSHPWIGTVIPGAMSVEQISANVEAGYWVLGADEAAELELL